MNISPAFRQRKAFPNNAFKAATERTATQCLDDATHSCRPAPTASQSARNIIRLPSINVTLVIEGPNKARNINPPVGVLAENDLEQRCSAQGPQPLDEGHPVCSLDAPPPRQRKAKLRQQRRMGSKDFGQRAYHETK
jgi:hypothetical protein